MLKKSGKIKRYLRLLIAAPAAAAAAAAAVAVKRGRWLEFGTVCRMHGYVMVLFGITGKLFGATLCNHKKRVLAFSHMIS